MSFILGLQFVSCSTYACWLGVGRDIMRSWVLAAFAAAAVLICQPAQAQSFPPGTFSIGGIPVACGPVWTVLQSGLGDAAKAIPPMGGLPPQIVIDPTIVGTMPQSVKLFFYAHECGHHVVGSNENAADCWAAKIGRQQGWFTAADMQYLVQIFQWNPGDWTHAPGPARLNNIWACFNS